MRTLSWKHTLGLVTMDVELADRTLSVAVTPVQAVVLLYFQDQGERPPQAGPDAAGGWAGWQRPPHGAGGDGQRRRLARLPTVPGRRRPQPAGPWRR